MALKEQPEETGQKTAGQILKEARQLKGIPLENVHSATKIPLDALKAIEEGYTIRSLSQFYRKGFIKMYANHLGLNPAELLSACDKENAESPGMKAEPSVQYPPKLKKKMVIPRLIIPKQLIPKPAFPFSSRQVIKFIAAVVVLAVVFKVAGCVRSAIGRAITQPKSSRASIKKEEKRVKSKKASKQKVPAVVPVKPAVKPVTPPVSDTAKKTETASAVTAEPAALKTAAGISSPTSRGVTTAADQKIRLTIKTLKQGWLQVKVDGAPVFQSTIKEGVSETWEADEKIELSGKNIHNLKFELNGKVLGSLGRADRSARRVIVTKDGLAVKQ